MVSDFEEKFFKAINNDIETYRPVIVFRNGFKDKGDKLRVIYFKLESELDTSLWDPYQKKILYVIRPFRYAGKIHLIKFL